MHELSIAQNIVDQVLAVVEKNPVERVRSILIEIGALSGVVEDSLAFCFPLVARGTVLEHTDLKVASVPLTLACHDCGAQTVSESLLFICGGCQGSNVGVMTGKEMIIKSIEVG